MHKGGKDSCQGDSGGPLIVSDSNNKVVIHGIGLFYVNFPSSQITHTEWKWGENTLLFYKIEP